MAYWEDHNKYASALAALKQTLKQILPVLQQNHSLLYATNETTKSRTIESDEVSAKWLIDLCKDIPSELSSVQLARSIVDASYLEDESSIQSALFDSLGFSDEAINLLQKVVPLMMDIRIKVSVTELDAFSANFPAGETMSQDDIDEQRRLLLRQEVSDAVEIAALAKAEYEALNTEFSATGRTSTHVVKRSSHQEAKKNAEKAEKRAAQLIKKAKDAGALLDEEATEFLTLKRTNPAGFGEGGLLRSSSEELRNLRQSLLPEGTRHYYDTKGLPPGAIRESTEKFERVIIPATKRDEANLPPRLALSDVILDKKLLKAFEGIKFLNPMQSATFEVAFHGRDNILVCAPTGAGKTNVAMLTALAHFRDALVVGSHANRDESVDIGKKVVYVAPMKALAQEVVEKFSARLKTLGLTVRELTGDMQLTRKEAEAADMIVTTPEKWDVVTRKSGTDDKSLGNQCGLLIIDEVHLLADERGAVIESIVSRLHRLVESRQRQIRIVALSATLPNYQDVAEFLQVSDRGLFYFGPEHRPVPLQQTFIGLRLKATDKKLKEKRLNEVCYDLVVEALKEGHQVMVFVHSRKGTGETVSALAEYASETGALDRFFTVAGTENSDAYGRYADRAQKSRNRQVAAYFKQGMGIHHAGMLRGDRKLTEQMFADGAIKVLCCTATLAWGINLPAHSVVIKGTEIYNPEKGGSVDLSILDVMQIFGRAGRPQYDTSGEATLITTHDAFQRYMDKLVRPIPIESNFIKQLADHLNAEVVGGTVSSTSDAATWLQYTYLYVRMLRNPMAYGISADQKADDPRLRRRCIQLVHDAAKTLDSNKMLRYHEDTGNLSVANNGRVAAHFYIRAESIATFNDMLAHDKHLTVEEVCRVICSASEFQNIKVRQEEMDELQKLMKDSCKLKIKGPGADDQGFGLITGAVDKAFVLLQAYISKAAIKSFTLISDTNYVASNAARVTRALFEICLKNENAGSALQLLRIAKSIEHQFWWNQTPLRHFASELNDGILQVFDSRATKYHKDVLDEALSLLEMQPDEVGSLCKTNKSGGAKVLSFVRMLPKLNISYVVKPVIGSVLKLMIDVELDFEWLSRWHGSSQSFWIWVENETSEKILHHEHISLVRKNFQSATRIEVSLPLFNSRSQQYIIRVVSDGWVGVEQIVLVPLENITMPTDKMRPTSLLNLTPLPKSALQNPAYEQLYSKLKTFNPIQTQLFHVVYNSDSPAILLGAPTGSGKTLIAELAILRMKHLHSSGICVYIAPLKALARERIKEWQKKFGVAPLNWSVLELSGETSHDLSHIQRADILICTPEKWDLVSRGWCTPSTSSEFVGVFEKNFMKRIRLLVIDEVHLLGEKRGAVLEAIVSRTRFISKLLQSQDLQQNSVDTLTRIVALSTALANPTDLASWLGIETDPARPEYLRGLYNFQHSVRPVPTVIHIQGFPGKHYCPRMATMNKPCFAAIRELSPLKPVLIFVASRRQTRLTAFDIISYTASEDNPKMFLGCSDTYVESITDNIRDETLRHTIMFGIGLHHAGLSSSDRHIVEQLFLERKIQILVATATLAWGVNLPAHLVIVKGTEYFDGKSSKYVDYPLTDVLQMIGRAGRPGFDTEAQAVVMVAEDKKVFFKKFLYTPFPVESCLGERLCETLNAEIVAGTIKSVTDGLGYMTWTFFARRVQANPTYYGAKSRNEDDVNNLLLTVVEQALSQLRESGCIQAPIQEDMSYIGPTTLGTACSSFYLSYQTPKQILLGLREIRRILSNGLQEPNYVDEATVGSNHTHYEIAPLIDNLTISWLLYIVCSTHEFDEHPVRHNEEVLNEDLSKLVTWGAYPATSDGDRPYIADKEIFKDPHTKCFLLVQAYVERIKFPMIDYENDAKMIVENVPRLLAAVEFIAAGEVSLGCFDLLTQLCRTRQIISTRSSVQSNPLTQLPGLKADAVQIILTEESKLQLHSLRGLRREDAINELRTAFRDQHPIPPFDKAVDVLFQYPLILGIKTSALELKESQGKRLGYVTVSIDLESPIVRRQKNHSSNGDSFTLTVLLGTMQKRFLLARSQVRSIGTGKQVVVKRKLEFDWSIAESDCDQQSNHLVLRVMLNEVRGLDVEMQIRF